jgi:hypothetical protein
MDWVPAVDTGDGGDAPANPAMGLFGAGAGQKASWDTFAAVVDAVFADARVV